MLNLRTWSPLLCSTLLAACGGSTSSLSSELPGHWASATCEPAGAAGFLHRDFVIEPDRYQVTLDVFADDACSARLLTAQVSGPLQIGEASTVVDGATEVNYVMTKRVLIPRQQPIVDALTAQCPGPSWAIDQEGDITVAGCAAFGFEPNPPCAQEMDLNHISGEELYFGDRSASLCAARPGKLGAIPVKRR
ncbi:MAG: hypothetical protein R3B48_13020 [Kofleriaceae bacterium]